MIHFEITVTNLWPHLKSLCQEAWVLLPLSAQLNLPGNLPAANASPGRWPFTPLVDRLAMWPSIPLRISRSVGYGLRGSPVKYDNSEWSWTWTFTNTQCEIQRAWHIPGTQLRGAHTALLALILWAYLMISSDEMLPAENMETVSIYGQAIKEKTSHQTKLSPERVGSVPSPFLALSMDFSFSFAW